MQPAPAVATQKGDGFDVVKVCEWPLPWPSCRSPGVSLCVGGCGPTTNNVNCANHSREEMQRYKLSGRSSRSGKSDRLSWRLSQPKVDGESDVDVCHQPPTPPLEPSAQTSAAEASCQYGERRMTMARGDNPVAWRQSRTELVQELGRRIVLLRGSWTRSQH